MSLLSVRFPPVRLPLPPFNQPYHYFSFIVSPLFGRSVSRCRWTFQGPDHEYEYDIWFTAKRYGVISFLKCAPIAEKSLEFKKTELELKLKLSRLFYLSVHVCCMHVRLTHCCVSITFNDARKRGGFFFFLKCRYICVKRKKWRPCSLKV